MTAATYDVAVIGAGIVGAACAAECARSGLRVAVVDRDAVGGGATAAGMGHVVLMDDSEAQFALTRYSQQLWQEFRPEFPSDVEYAERGTIWIAADDEEMAEVHRKHTYYGDRGVATEVLDPSAIEQLEPNLRKGMAGGLLVPTDIVLNPPAAARYLMERAQVAGAKIHLGVSVSQIGSGQVRLAGGTSFSASVIVNAAGPWASGLTPGADVRKRKGHLVMTDCSPGFVRHQLVELGYLKSAHSISTDSVAFNVQPQNNGQIVVGSSRQYGVEYPEVDALILNRMLERAHQYMPKLAKIPIVRTWTGFRPASSDQLPLIGPWPGDPTLFLATGHEGLGITTSLATGRLVADQITGKKSAIPVAPYWPSRLSLKHASETKTGHAESKGGRK